MSNEIMAAVTDDQLGRMALIEAVRAQTDALKRFGDDNREQGKKLDEIRNQLSEFNTRMALIEHDGLREEVKQLREAGQHRDERIRLLENDLEQRKGALSLVEWIGKNWPGIAGFVALVAIMLVATGKLHL